MKNETNIEKHQRVAREISELIIKEYPGAEENTQELLKAVSAIETGANLALLKIQVKINIDAHF